MKIALAVARLVSRLHDHFWQTTESQDRFLFYVAYAVGLPVGALFGYSLSSLMVYYTGNVFGDNTGFILMIVTGLGMFAAVVLLSVRRQL